MYIATNAREEFASSIFRLSSAQMEAASYTESLVTTTYLHKVATQKIIILV
jgi:hypothetical protein